MTIASIFSVILAIYTLTLSILMLVEDLLDEDERKKVALIGIGLTVVYFIITFFF